MKFKIITILVVGFFLSASPLKAQLANTLYFIDNAPVRHQFNPAFQPLSNFYLSLPAIGNTQLSFGNNRLTLSSLELSKAGVLNSLKSSVNVGTEAYINLLGFGFRSKAAYWTFSATAKSIVNTTLPSDAFKLLLYGNAETLNGVPTLSNSIFDLSSMYGNGTGFIEAALGYSREINDKLQVGIKLKYLHGLAGSKLKVNTLGLESGIDDIRINGNGTVFSSYPDMESITVNTFLKPSGKGGAIDLGATYKPIKNLEVAASVSDLGMINWSGKNVINYTESLDYMFQGINGFNISNVLKGIDTGNLTDSIYDDIQNNLIEEKSYESFTTNLSPRINLSAEYSFLNELLSVGVLGSTKVMNKKIYPEITTALNVKPANWFNFSLSYSVLNGRGSNIGAGLGFRLGFINLFAAADYIPMHYTTLATPIKLNLSSVGMGNITLSKVPYKTDRLNLAVGFNIVFGNKQDDDKDGVRNRKDECPDTPLGVIVQKNGCPLDTDGDGVHDYVDKCPDTPKEAHGTVDADGCPMDTDGDGVFDYKDKCPGTPVEAYATVDSLGCPKDTDLDKVPDYKDKCPETPEAERAMVDTTGCNKVVLEVIDENSANGVNAANGTNALNGKNIKTDKDGDGIPDELDHCPEVAGVSTNGGCPEIKNEVKVIFQKALLGIQFETGSFKIKPLSYVILDHVARVLSENANYQVEVGGHTDNVGKPQGNQILSDRRADAVRSYLISKGIAAERLTAKGYGDTRPTAPNTTAEGRKTNRRVEFIVSYQ
ncbi:MAG: OmpA family protein [Paludibacter sp.]|nr:OmpA family protein [Paludibacter sp.]